MKNDRIYIAAHRGGYEFDYKDKAPENSIANIKNAINKGFEIYESDVRRTKDGVFIIMHDRTIDRTTTGKGEVKKLLFVQIERYRLKYSNGEIADQKIPELKEFIKNGNHELIFKFDYKCEPKHLKSIIEQIHQTELQDYVILRYYYDEEIIKELINIGYKNTPEFLFRIEFMKEYEELRGKFNIRMISINTKEKNYFTPEQIEIIKLANKDKVLVEVHSFDDNSESRREKWDNQLKLPVNIVHTKKPILLKEYLKERMLR